MSGGHRSRGARPPTGFPAPSPGGAGAGSDRPGDLLARGGAGGGGGGGGGGTDRWAVERGCRSRRSGRPV